MSSFSRVDSIAVDDADSTSRLAAIAAVVPFVVFAAVYVPMAGHGLIQDDFSWILRSRVASLTDVIALFRSDNGFYRPVVSLTFAVNEWMFGATPYGYGLTNAALGAGVRVGDRRPGARARPAARRGRARFAQCGSSIFTVSAWPCCG